LRSVPIGQTDCHYVYADRLPLPDESRYEGTFARIPYFPLKCSLPPPRANLFSFSVGFPGTGDWRFTSPPTPRPRHSPPPLLPSLPLTFGPRTALRSLLCPCSAALIPLDFFPPTPFPTLLLVVRTDLPAIRLLRI